MEDAKNAKNRRREQLWRETDLHGLKLLDGWDRGADCNVIRSWSF